MNPSQDSPTVKAIKGQLTGKRFGKSIVQPGVPKAKKKPTPVGKAPAGKKTLYRGSGKSVSTGAKAPKGPKNGSRRGIKSPVIPGNTGF